MTAEVSSPVPTVAEKPGISHAWRALRHRNFRLYFSGQTISLIGTWMTLLATSWLVFRLTGSALLLGIVGFSGQIPTFIFAPFAGVWIDRLDRRKVLVITQILAMLQSLVERAALVQAINEAWSMIAVLTIGALLCVPFAKRSSYAV